MKAVQEYGQKIEYDPLWSGPLDKIRSPTDVAFRKCLSIFFVIWLGIAIYAHSYEGTPLIELFKEYPKTAILAHAVCKCMLLSAFLSIAYILLLRWSAKVIAYIVIILCFISLFAVICLAGYYYVEEQTTTNLLTFVAPVIIFVVLLIIVVKVYKKINIACQMMREASKCIFFFPSSFLLPLLSIILMFGVFMLSINISFCLSTLSEVHQKISFLINAFTIVNCIGLWWMYNFVIGFTQIVLSGSFATWYWTQDKNHVSSHTLVRFIKITMRNHLGTIAFGSLIISMCQLIKKSLKIFKRQSNDGHGTFSFFCSEWYQYIFGNLEKIFKYISRYAYVMSAVHGTNFFQSAKDAFNLILRNILKCLIVDTVTSGILLVGGFLIIVLSLVLFVAESLSQQLDDQSIASIGMVIIFASYMTVRYFFTVIQAANDTIFLCVLEDYERNDGSAERPYYMSEKLKKLFLEQ